jgi:hypothetical protein
MVELKSVPLADRRQAGLRRALKPRGEGRQDWVWTGVIVTGIVAFPGAPLFLLIKGKDVTIPGGLEFPAYVNEAVSLDPAKLSRAAPKLAPGPAAESANRADRTTHPLLAPEGPLEFRLIPEVFISSADKLEYLLNGAARDGFRMIKSTNLMARSPNSPSPPQFEYKVIVNCPEKNISRQEQLRQALETVDRQSYQLRGMDSWGRFCHEANFCLRLIFERTTERPSEPRKYALFDNVPRVDEQVDERWGGLSDSGFLPCGMFNSHNVTAILGCRSASDPYARMGLLEYGILSFSVGSSRNPDRTLNKLALEGYRVELLSDIIYGGYKRGILQMGNCDLPPEAESCSAL